MLSIFGVIKRSNFSLILEGLFTIGSQYNTDILENKLKPEILKKGSVYWEKRLLLLQDDHTAQSTLKNH